MTDEDISNLFEDAIETFPTSVQEEARQWLAERQAAHRLVMEIQEKGLSALL